MRAHVVAGAMIVVATWSLPVAAQDVEPEPAPEPPVEAAPPPPAPVVPPTLLPRFGTRGVFVITGDWSIGVGRTTYENSGVESLSATFSPGLDYFVTRHVSIGFDLFVQHRDESVVRNDLLPGGGVQQTLVRSKTTALGLGPRVGVELPLGRWASLYPRLEGGYEHLAFGSRAFEDVAWLSAFVPIVVHPAPHFFVGAGPTLSHVFGPPRREPELGGGTNALGAHALVGIWWGGEREEIPDAAPDTEARFGESGQLVISNEFSFGASYVANDAVDTFRIGVVPGFDYFVLDHVSLGIAASFFHDESWAHYRSGHAYLNGGGIAPRIGCDLPLASWLSFFPRAMLRFESYSATTDGVDSGFSVIAGSIYAPLLVHPMKHAFAGLGPFVAHDLSRKLDSGKDGNAATSYGADFVVGGWL